MSQLLRVLFLSIRTKPFEFFNGMTKPWPGELYTTMHWKRLIYHVPAPGVLFLSIRSKSF